MQRTIELARTATARTSTSVETAAQPEPNEELRVEHVATAKLPTKYGDFQIVAFKNNRDGKDHVAIIKGDIEGQERVSCRIHSECLTGDAFGSLKCDCGPQLEAALEQIEELGQGIILYM